ncbi:MAG: hypothetical protein WC848_03940 [Parcubacteria group bacterium]|jgi:hypothetical protein
MSENKLKFFEGKSLNGKIKFFFGQEFFRSRIVLWLLFLGVFFNLVIWSVLKFYSHPAGSSIILHYNVYFGVDSIGASREVFLLPSIGFIVLLINVLLSFYFYVKKERIASYVLLLAALMVQLSLLISAISVIIINY